MKELSPVSKIFMYISFLCGSLWIGAYLTRVFLAYQLFEAEDMVWKSFINNENSSGILFSMLPAITTTFILYLAMIVFFVMFLLTSKISLKKNGWLFIVSLIIFITLPFEIYLMTIDYKLILMLNAGTFDVSKALILFKNRVEVLSSFPLVEIFCYISAVYFILFQPLKAKEKAAL